MILRSITIANFKNIAEASLAFSPKLNCLLGDNGMGKSNLLDAIYFLSFCKSFAGVNDALVIARGQDFAMVQGAYTRHGAEESLALALRRGRRKSLKRSGKEYGRLSEHIGLFPAVLVAPADMDLVNGTGEERRRFMDMVISQTDARYLDALIRYGRALEQRNSLLRQGAEDPNLYIAMEMAMASAARYVCSARSEWVEKLEGIFKRYYRDIAGEGEEPELAYVSHLRDGSADLTALLDERRRRDLALGYTTAGPHRDDVEMTLSGLPVRRSASQGQAKTYTIALRLAQYEFLKEATGLSPLLLLDDIFDKLDAKRVESIMAVVAMPTFGQIFISDTNRKHLDTILRRTGGDYAMFAVDHGSFSPTTPSEP